MTAGGEDASSLRLPGGARSGDVAPPRAGRVEVAVAAAVVVGAGLAVVVGSFQVIAVVARLAGWTLLVAGVAVTVGRNGTVDLAAAGVAAVGAYVGAVAATSHGWEPAVGLVVGTVAAAVAGGLAGSLAGRVGGQLAALPTLSLTLGLVAVLRAWPEAGGSAGFHAIPFLTGGDRGDALVAVLAAGAGLAVAARWWRSHAAAVASLASRAPDVAAALGRRPAVATGLAGAVGGLLLGAGGAVQATVSGSVSPGGFGLELAAALALAALVGGRAPLGPVVGAAILWGPSVLFPLAPVVGDAPPLLTTGTAALAILALRRGRSLVAGPALTPWVRPAIPDPDTPLESVDPSAPDPVAATVPPVLEVAATDRHDALEVRPGEVVAVTGPNGAGKSTLLAQIGGQLRDRGLVRLDGRAAPHGPTRRARAGLARTWQRPPAVPLHDLLHGAAARTARDPQRTTATGRHLGEHVAGLLGTAADRTAAGQVVAALTTAPRVLLLDEPATSLPEEAVARAVAAIARAGVGVVLVDHRPAVLAVAHRTVAVRAPGAGAP